MSINEFILIYSVSRFRGYDQQDSHELLCYLFDAIKMEETKVCFVFDYIFCLVNLIFLNSILIGYKYEFTTFLKCLLSLVYCVCYAYKMSYCYDQF